MRDFTPPFYHSVTVHAVLGDARAISAGALTCVAHDRAAMKQSFIFPPSRYFGVCR